MDQFQKIAVSVVLVAVLLMPALNDFSNPQRAKAVMVAVAGVVLVSSYVSIYGVPLEVVPWLIGF